VLTLRDWTQDWPHKPLGWIKFWFCDLVPAQGHGPHHPGSGSKAPCKPVKP